MGVAKRPLRLSLRSLRGARQKDHAALARLGGVEQRQETGQARGEDRLPRPGRLRGVTPFRSPRRGGK
jgi:hypothetical protein